MSTTDNIEVIRRAMDMVNSKDLSSMPQVMAPGAVRHDLAGAVPDAIGREGITDFLQAVFLAIPDVRIQIEDILASGDRVVARISAEGTHAGEFLGVTPTGKRVNFAGINIYRMDDGKIAETWQMTDWAGFLRQVGA